MWNKVHLFMHLSVSLCRVIIGLLVALILAIPLAYIFASLLPKTYASLEALLKIFSLINPYCLFPLFIVFFGSSELAKIGVLAWVSLWPIFFMALAGIKHVDPLLVKTASSMGANDFTIFYKVIIPLTIPSIFNGVRIGVQMSFFILIAAEMTGAIAGLGWIVHSAGALNQVNMIYAAGVLIVLLGVFLNRFLSYVHDGLFFWRSELDPIKGIINPSSSQKALSPLKLFCICAGFLLILGIGVYEIYLAEILLNDPSVIPEYRVWTE
jgi:NitT/TauT family transport system permease protein